MDKISVDLVYKMFVKWKAKFKITLKTLINVALRLLILVIFSHAYALIREPTLKYQIIIQDGINIQGGTFPKY